MLRRFNDWLLRGMNLVWTAVAPLVVGGITTCVLLPILLPSYDNEHSTPTPSLDPTSNSTIMTLSPTTGSPDASAVVDPTPILIILGPTAIGAIWAFGCMAYVACVKHSRNRGLSPAQYEALNTAETPFTDDAPAQTNPATNNNDPIEIFTDNSDSIKASTLHVVDAPKLTHDQRWEAILDQKAELTKQLDSIIKNTGLTAVLKQIKENPNQKIENNELIVLYISLIKNMLADIDLPSTFKCPISYGVIEHAAMANDHFYEKRFIEPVLGKQDPLDRNKIIAEIVDATPHSRLIHGIIEQAELKTKNVAAQLNKLQAITQQSINSKDEVKEHDALLIDFSELPKAKTISNEKSFSLITANKSEMKRSTSLPSNLSMFSHNANLEKMASRTIIHSHHQQAKQG